MKQKYPYIHRHDWFHGHSYILHLTETVRMDLTPEQYDNLKTAVHEIDEMETPLTPGEIDDMIHSIQNRLTQPPTHPGSTRPHTH